MSEKKDRKRGMLRSISFDEVSFVGKGANQHAHVSIIKMEEPLTDPEEILKGIFTEIVDGQSEARAMRQLLRDMCFFTEAFQEAFYSIIRDNQGYPNKKNSVLEALGEFANVMTSLVTDTDVIKAFEEISKIIEYREVLEKKAVKTEGGKQFPASDYAYVPDPEKSSTWKLRLTSTPGGKPDPRIVGAAVAALGKGFRGKKVQIPADKLSAVKAKVRRAWLSANPDKTREDLPAIIKKSNKEIKMEKKLEFYKSMAELSDAEREYFNGLPEDARNVLVEKGDFVADVKTQAVEAFKKAANDDESFQMGEVTVKKSEVGEAAFVVMKAQQKQIEISKQEAANALSKLEDVALAKEADMLFPNLPGTAEEKGAILKSIRTLSAAQQESQIKMLKAGDAAVASQMGENGHNNPGGDESASETLNKMAKEKAEKDNITFAKAYSEVMSTPEGIALYEKTLN